MGNKVGLMKRFCYRTILLSVAVALIACRLTQRAWKQPDEPGVNKPGEAATVSPVTGEALQTGQTIPSLTLTPGTPKPEPAARDMPPQSQAAEIRPAEMRLELTRLSKLLGYQVLDKNGNKLGAAVDFVVNTCETYIIYILMEPEASLNPVPGSRIAIPFEAVTINSGVLDAQSKAIQLRLLPEQFVGAPTLLDGQTLTPTDWEAAVRNFWSKALRIGMLATSCNVSGGPVYKVAYATQLLGVNLYDGQDNLLGVVQEAILEPESGKIGFYIVKPAQGDGLVVVRLQATNIPKEALLPGGTLTLVLLVDPLVFQDAPRIDQIEEADDAALQSQMRQYWGR